MKRILFFIMACCSLSLQAQVNYVSQTGNFNAIQTVNTTANYYAGAYNNNATELGTYANVNVNDGSGYIGDPGVATFRTFTIDGVGTGTARPMKVGDQFAITCYVANSSAFFNNSNAGISFNGGTTYSAFSNYSSNQRAKFQINQNGAWFGATSGAANGYANAGQDVTFTVKLTSVKTANLTISSANGSTTYDMVLANSPSATADNIQSFAIWNQTSGVNNNMYWKGGVLTSTGTVEIGNGNASATFDGLITNGLAANSTSTVSVNSLTKSGTGVITLTAANNYTGSTTIAGGELRLNPAANLSTTTPFILQNGTTLSTTGIAAGRTITSSGSLSTLNLSSGSATLALASGVNHTITFANSSGITWNGTALTITGWGGTAGQTNASGGKVFVGVGGLTTAQLQKISFSGYSGTPIILASGELVPPGPNLAVVSGSLNHGSICQGTAASTITYTVNNTGGNATGVTVTSNSSEFVVSNQSSTTINGGGSMTYQVTFTPNTSGTRNGTITINTATPNSNAPVTSNVTGTGIARVVPTFNSVADICYGAALSPLPTTSLNGITGTWAPPLNNTSTTEYTFTPTAGQCASLTYTKLTIVVNQGTTYYTDADNDGYGNLASPVVSCAGQPAGTVTNSTDCDDTNHSIYQNGNFYVDADNDGYYNGNPETTVVCYGTAVPSGYTNVIIGTDCLDTNGEVNPNHVEVMGNGIDDNCDGTVDEVAPTSSLQPNQCGSTLTNIAQAIYANQVAAAQGYRFEVTQGASVRTYDSATSSFNLLNLTGGATYATTYAIRVAVKTAPGFWRAYSASCNITTPAVPATTKVVTSQCGSTLTSLANTIYCDQVTAATQYRFEVSGGPEATRTFDTAVNRFSLTNLSGGASYASTYAVRIALLIGGVWQDYGTSCNITTPLTPTPSYVTPSQCGITISNSWTTIYATQVPEATGYRFEVVNGATTRYFDTPNARFNLHNLAGAAPAPNTTYAIRVAILYNSVYQPFGPSCSITTAAVITRQAPAALAIFDVKASPNPFANGFKLQVNTSDETQIGLQVYDMVGRQLENRHDTVSAIMEQEIGNQYPSGVYNVIVTQGENVKTLRLIKR